ncbi:MAG: type II toxin-antitoxin system VapC family toxin [Gemmatimonadota bacterium]|nr:type II toxin-antitoxin system VapC family toxin [Gemmatimonadota bacterium]MDE2870881.1 type II toxin-antitoxin system VapC family toxin [Gemmatimonadota bacterium]
MTRYCLDTSAYISFMRGDAAAVEAIDGASWIGFPVIALGELYTGHSLTGNRPAELQRMRDFLAHPVVEIIAADNEVARAYGRLVAELRKAGTPLPTNDIWIAACAARTSSVVLTHDAHFTCIDRVGCELLGGGSRKGVASDIASE